MAARSRLLLVGTFFSAFRSAVRPGSPSMGERLSAVPRMVRATVSGRYRGLAYGRLALIAGAVLYILSPVDLFPEAILSIVGLADDAVVLSWLAAAVVTETETFLLWERECATAGRAGPRGAETVPGSVVTPHSAPPQPGAGPRARG